MSPIRVNLAQPRVLGVSRADFLALLRPLALLLTLPMTAAVYAAEAGTSRAAIEDQVVQTHRASPEILVAPLSTVVPASKRNTAPDLMRALDVTTAITGTNRVAPTDRAANTASANVVPAATSIATSAARAGANSSGKLSPNGSDDLQDIAISPNGTANDIVYRSIPGDRLDISPRFSDRGIARKFDGEVAVSAGTGGSLSTSASVTLPLIDNVLSVRISGSKGRGQFSRRDYFSDQPLRFNDYESSGGSNFGFDLRWAPTDSFNMNLQTSKTQDQFRARNRR